MTRNTFAKLVLWGGLLSSTLLTLTASAATRNWSGTTDDNWSLGGVGGNWTGAAIPTSVDDVVFNEVDTAGIGVTTNIVDNSFPSVANVSTIRTLSYLFTNTSPNYNHTTEIAAGRTLLATTGMNVATGSSTQVGGLILNTTIRGGVGSVLQVGITSAHTANFNFAEVTSNTANPLTATLDMTNLETFNAHVNLFEVGVSAGGVAAILNLAKSNFISANQFLVTDGGAGNPGGADTVRLGQLNTIDATTIVIGGSKGSGIVEYNTGLTDPELFIRGTSGGTTRANLTIGQTLTNTSGNPTSRLDASAGSLDARVNNLVIGTRNQVGTAVVPALQGILTMSEGLLDVNTILAGNSAQNITTRGFLNVQGGDVIVNTSTVTFGQTSTGVTTAAGVGEGTLNLSGGSFTAPAILLGNKQTANGSAIGIINLSGGTLTAGSIAKGATGTATFNFTGGELDVNTLGFGLNQQGGTLLTETGSTTINGNYNLQAAGTLQVTLTNALTPALIVNGTTSLGGNLEILIGDDFELPAEGETIDIVTSTGALSGQFIDVANNTEFQIGDVLFTLSYTSGTVTLSNFQYYVPEPSSASLLAIGLLVFTRRRRKIEEARVSSAR